MHSDSSHCYGEPGLLTKYPVKQGVDGSSAMMFMFWGTTRYSDRRLMMDVAHCRPAGSQLRLSWGSDVHGS